MGIFDKARDPLRDPSGRSGPDEDQRSTGTRRALDRDDDQTEDPPRRDTPAEPDRTA